jgi:hypothetical protein
LHIAYRCWTDSTVALGWIKGEPRKWKTFVANGVTEIQQLTDPSMWSHCPGKGNPADLLTRGVLAEELVSSEQWLQGPSWMSDSVQLTYSDESLFERVEQFLQPERVYVMVVSKKWVPLEQVLPVERWGKFTKAVRVS